MTKTDRHNGVALVKKDSPLAGAAVSAAVGLAVYGLRKALAKGRGEPRPAGGHVREEDERGETGRSALATVWESAPEELLSLAEDAAGAAGRWAARNFPAPIRERLLPRFIDAFKAAA
jgi:hypothetical protein